MTQNKKNGRGQEESKNRQIFDAKAGMSHGHQYGLTEGREPGQLSEPVRTPEVDPESQAFLRRLAEQEKVRGAKLPSVRTVLVVMSGSAMVFDMNALRQKVLLTYPEVAVFFTTPLFIALGAPPPDQVDLMIDFTGARQKQRWFLPRKLRKMARVTVGRNAGWGRKRLYDRVYDEKAQTGLPADQLERERIVQREVLALAGIPLWQAGDTLPDRGKITPLELPPLARA